MNELDLLERRANRGTPRGASTVWQNAEANVGPSLQTRSTLPRRDAQLGWYRAVVGLAAAFALVLAFGVSYVQYSVDTSINLGPAADSDQVDSDQYEPDLGQSPLLEGQQPPPIFMTGQPSDDSYSPMELVDVRVNDASIDPSEAVFWPEPELAHPIQLFGHQSEPFEHAIVVVGLGPDGNQYEVLNFESGTKESIEEGITQTGGEWEIDPSLDLTEVASFDEYPFPDKPSWTLVFEENRYSGLSQESTSAFLDITPEGSIWPSIARIALQEERSQSLQRNSTTALGKSAVVLEDRAFWLEGDVLYDLIVFDETVDPDHRNHFFVELPDPGIFLPALEVVDQSEWDEQARSAGSNLRWLRDYGFWLEFLDVFVGLILPFLLLFFTIVRISWIFGKDRSLLKKDKIFRVLFVALVVWAIVVPRIFY